VNVPVLPANTNANTLGVVNNTRKAKNALINNTQLSNTLVNNTRVNNTRVNNTRVNNTLSTNVLTTKVSQNKRNNVIPDGKVYIPTPQVAPANAYAKQKGGANALPAAILGSLSMLLRGKTRRYKGKRQ